MSPNSTLHRLITILSCEHATSHVPKRYTRLFVGYEDVLRSHRGWDPGTHKLGKQLQKALDCKLYSTQVSRLLVEVNRSPGHPCLFSEFTRSLSSAEREQLVTRYYDSHRQPIEQEIKAHTDRGFVVLHLSLHSFTPELNGQVRNADVAFLYDPQRRSEREFCSHGLQTIGAENPSWRLRRNYPYRGTSDGLTTYLRRKFPSSRYLGIELEVNQRLMETGTVNDTVKKLVRALTTAISSMSRSK